jgi:chromosome partitioning protein
MGAQSILIINSKGGAGTSTLSSNLASYYAQRGLRTGIFDFDRQMSSIRWLQRRPENAPSIAGKTGWGYHDVKEFDRIVMDPPAQICRKDLATLVARADVVIVPVLPSPIDIHAAADFIRDLLVEAKVRTKQKPVAVVANRARSNTLIYDQLKRFLNSLNIPFVATIRDTQNYIHASAQGLGIFEMNRSGMKRDVELWQPLLQWIEAKLQAAAGQIPQPAGPGMRPVLRAVK